MRKRYSWKSNQRLQFIQVPLSKNPWNISSSKLIFPWNFFSRFAFSPRECILRHVPLPVPSRFTRSRMRTHTQLIQSVSVTWTWSNITHCFVNFTYIIQLTKFNCYSRFTLCSHQPILTFIPTSNIKLPNSYWYRYGWCELESVLESVSVNNTVHCKHFWSHSFKVYSHQAKSEILLLHCDWWWRQQCSRFRSDTDFVSA